MENEKKFGNEMFGYSKNEVDEYVKDLKSDYETKLQSEKSDTNRLSNEITILKKKLERYEHDYIQRQEKVANALITAEDQSKKILESARSEALKEKERLEQMLEIEKEQLIDARKEIGHLKEDAVKILEKYTKEIAELLE